MHVEFALNDGELEKMKGAFSLNLLVGTCGLLTIRGPLRPGAVMIGPTMVLSWPRGQKITPNFLCTELSRTLGTIVDIHVEKTALLQPQQWGGTIRPLGVVVTWVRGHRCRETRAWNVLSLCGFSSLICFVLSLYISLYLSLSLSLSSDYFSFFLSLPILSQSLSLSFSVSLSLCLFLSVYYAERIALAFLQKCGTRDFRIIF